MENQLSAPAFEQFLAELIESNPDGVQAVLKRFRIANQPTPKVLVLASVKHGDAFVSALAQTAQVVENLSYTGVDTSVLQKYGNVAVMDQAISQATANAQAQTAQSEAERQAADQYARQEKIKSLIWGGVKAVQTGAEYLKNKKNNSFQTPQEETYDYQVKKPTGDNTRKYYFIAGGVLLALIVVFGVVVAVKKRKS
jgi:hypothetical protein